METPQIIYSKCNLKDKINIRERILSKIKNGDRVLLLESPKRALW